MRYAALFRGINVGGKNVVKMDILKKMFAEMGFSDVRTYIQSGNVLFGSDDDADAISGQIKDRFPAVFGFECAVMLRSRDEIERIITSLPFTDSEIAAAEAASAEVEHLYVYTLDKPPAQDDVLRLQNTYSGPDLLRCGGREIYLLCHQSVRDSKLAASLTKLQLPMTARNWKTMNKLRGMLAV